MKRNIPGFDSLHFVAGGSLTAVAIIGAGILLSRKPEGESWPGVLTLLSDFAGHPKPVILAQIRAVMAAAIT